MRPATLARMASVARAVRSVGSQAGIISDGGLSIDELNELLDLQLPDDDWDTVGGFLLGTLGHVPEEGENVEHDGYAFAVEKMEGHRIAQVRVTRPQTGEGA